MNRRIEPTRLTLARRRVGLSKTQLAQRLGVSSATVGHWEEGRRDATPKIALLAILLGQPEEFFFGPEIPVTEAQAVSFRRRQDATRMVRDRAAAACDLAAGILSPAIRNVFGRLPAVDVPDLSDLSPEAAAEALRHHWNLSDAPLRDAVAQLEARGVRVFWVNEATPSLSAFCRWVDSEPFIILNTAKRDGCRSRFDAAHELGHLVLHREVDFDSADTRDIEREADRFASAFLLPRTSFLRVAPSVFDKDRLLELKGTWKVSIQAMVRRLRDCSVFSEWQYETAYIKMSSWGWRSNPEPLAGEMEGSVVHWKLCDRLAERDISPQEWVSDINVAWDDVSQMMPVLPVRQAHLSISNMMSSSGLINLDLDVSDTLPFGEGQ
jgi:Zn-dependent peptidase ImmA (M78 family)/DNA-binding XRE family transcriptional regulator